MKALAKRLLGRLVQEYRINWIYAADMPPATGADHLAEPETAAHRATFAASTTDKVRKSQSYAKVGLAGLVLTEAGRPMSVAHFAETDHYDRHGTWPLKPGQVALMNIATEEAARGRGLAAKLIQAATCHYLAKGSTRLIAFIWWSNTPSLRAFTKAGWKRIGLSLEIRVTARWFVLRIPVIRSLS
jgi:GNAT superfamily N-acetyltransferase